MFMPMHRNQRRVVFKRGGQTLQRSHELMLRGSSRWLKRGLEQDFILPSSFPLQERSLGPVDWISAVSAFVPLRFRASSILSIGSVASLLKWRTPCSPLVLLPRTCIAFVRRVTHAISPQNVSFKSLGCATRVGCARPCSFGMGGAI